ncbi:MAG: capsule biosynthesis protein [Desulfovibrio sp.]|nr:capsule biosynthesis protein [Desulfovibrio sp.]
MLLPACLIFLYLMLIASPMYVSEARFAVRGQNATQGMDPMASMFRVATTGLQESYIVQDYIGSLDIVEKLDAKLHLRQHYADKTRDFWFRLWSNATQDETREYWKWAVTTSFDPDTGILIVQVKAFTPEMSLALCQGILDSSEALVNAMNERAREDAISQARQEVARAEQRVREAREASRIWRERTVILDPNATASGLYGLVNNLEAAVTNTAAELAEALTFMKNNSPRVVQLRNKLAVLQQQLAKEKERLAGESVSGVPLSSVLSEYQRLAVEEEFAQKQLTSAMSSLETARVRADAKSLYVEPYERPVLADESLYPRPFYFTFIFMVTSLLLLGLVSLIIAAVREHAGF